MKGKILAPLAFVIIALMAYFYYTGQRAPEPKQTAGLSSTPTPAARSTAAPLLPSDISKILDDNKKVPLDTVPGSYTVLVNRDYLLPSDYIPEDLVEPAIRFSHSEQGDKRKLRKVAATALEKMFGAAEKKGIILYGVSGYRSYLRQESIYRRNVALHGKSATDTLSAKPGTSEHQTGLTIDISAASVGCKLTSLLASTREGKWLKKNAHKYGFIIRYPKGKTKVTGYSFEPWHIRYVGTTVATYLYKNKLTLEEYYGEYNKSHIKTGVDVEDTKNYKEEETTSSSDQ